MENQIFQTAPDIAYQIISRKILEGEYPPGMKLSRRKMAEVTGTSVIPVIEAMKKLEEDRLVESKPKWGSFVTVPTLKKIRQSFQVREAIECTAARYLARNMTPEQDVILTSLATELDTVPYSRESAFNTGETHLAFHRKVTEFLNNPLMSDALKKVNLLWILCSTVRSRAPSVEYPRYWHRLLMDRIRSGDPSVAEEAMRVHVYDGLDAIEAGWPQDDQ